MLNATVDASLRFLVLALVASPYSSARCSSPPAAGAGGRLPRCPPAQVNIHTESPGVAAEDIERLLTAPIEAAMAGLRPT
ncbi:MAG: hypothetical protein IPK05_19700 [Comamonadaceae bacterium]|nr:hypothetical protein [Comamonadaceae bacterium]